MTYEPNKFQLFFKYCQVKGQKLWEHDSEITGDPNGSLRGPITFWSSFEA